MIISSAERTNSELTIAPAISGRSRFKQKRPPPPKFLPRTSNPLFPLVTCFADSRQSSILIESTKQTAPWPMRASHRMQVPEENIKIYVAIFVYRVHTHTIIPALIGNNLRATPLTPYKMFYKVNAIKRIFHLSAT